MESNRKTLETYQEHFSNYIEGTTQETSGSQKEWLDSVLSRQQKDATILEVGSAFGRDATYVRDQGYENLIVTDAFDAATTELQSKGFAAQKLNVLTDEIPSNNDLIIASAVFLHFTKAELENVLVKVWHSLNRDGILAFSVKAGEGEEWTSHKMGAPRFFQYWQPGELVEKVERAGFNVVDVRTVEDDKWLCLTCQKSDE